MNRNLKAIVKWLPLESDELRIFFSECNQLKFTMKQESKAVAGFIRDSRVNNSMKLQQKSTDKDSFINHLDIVCNNLDKIKDGYNAAFQNSVKDPKGIIGFKIKTWHRTLWICKLELTYFIQLLISDVIHLFIYYGESFLATVFKIANVYNELVSIDTKYGMTNNLAVFNNTCPYLLYPLKKFTITRFLQILSRSRSELCCHKLIDCLLETYRKYDEQTEDETSDNSDMEIYRALTQHLTPTHFAGSIQHSFEVLGTGSFSNLDELIKYEVQNVIDLLMVAMKITPSLFGKDGLKRDKDTGLTRICTNARKKVVNYYQDVLWTEAGSYLEHIILWWGSAPLSARPPHSSQHLRDWIVQFTPVADIPVFITGALTTLADALGVHVTSTSWDQHFRSGIVSSLSSTRPARLNDRPGGGGTVTGQLFVDMLADLVTLCNQCEVTNEWIVGAPLDELPLVEQIPVLHRLDHSVHTVRLWAISETKKLANNWNVHSFFLITHADIVQCLQVLSGLRLVDHGATIENGGLGVHVEVCSKMRAKLVSEVQVNIDKLKSATLQCVHCLSSICTTLSLAHLKMIFPRAQHWRSTDRKFPQKANDYVDKYLDEIFTPILQATSDAAICNAILKLMGEAWLEHIYRARIRFSEHGARQLLVDFDRVGDWLVDSHHDTIDPVLRRRLARNEVLRRCEGVGKLLLRTPGERIDMRGPTAALPNTSANGTKHGVDGDDDDADVDSLCSTNTVMMPAEMYVPNQEQWLELRAKAKRSLLVPMCCSDVTTN